jgi:hypothetical protein
MCRTLRASIKLQILCFAAAIGIHAMGLPHAGTTGSLLELHDPSEFGKYLLPAYCSISPYIVSLAYATLDCACAQAALAVGVGAASAAGRRLDIRSLPKNVQWFVRATCHGHELATVLAKLMGIINAIVSIVVNLTSLKHDRQCFQMRGRSRARGNISCIWTRRLVCAHPSMIATNSSSRL